MRGPHTATREQALLTATTEKLGQQKPSTAKKKKKIFSLAKPLGY